MKILYKLNRTLTLCFFVSCCLLPASSLAADPPSDAKKAETQEKAESENKVLAKVNATEIMESEVMAALNTTIAQNKQMHGVMGSDDQMEVIKKNVLDQLIATEVLYQKAKETKMKDLKERVDEAFNSFKEKYDKPEDFKTALQGRSMTEETLRKEIEKGTQIQELIDAQVIKKIVIPEEEITSFYETNKERFREEETVKASHILIRVAEDAKKAEDKEALKKIKNILKQVKKGEDFIALAKEHSEDPSAAQNGGDLGYFTHKQMVPEFDKAVFALKVGEISDAIKTSFGYHIIKCDDKKPERVVPFEEVKDRISQHLERKAFQSKLTEYIESLKKNADIKIVTK